MNLNPSGDSKWEGFTLDKENVGFPRPLADDMVPSIPNGDYRLELKGLDARNTVFISFKRPHCAVDAPQQWTGSNHRGEKRGRGTSCRVSTVA